MNRKISQATVAMLLVVGLGGLVPSASAQSGKPRNADIENIGKRDINKGRTNFTSLEKEKEIGRLAAAQFEQNVALDSDPVTQKYVNRVAQDIAKNSDSKLPITI